MKAPDGTFWIGSDHPFDLAECYLNFRADVALQAVPKAAILHLSADSRYRLWVNGAFIGRGPERSWPSSMAVDARDVTAELRPGPNHIAVQVYSPGHLHFAYVHRAACGMIGWLDADGKALLRSDQKLAGEARSVMECQGPPRLDLRHRGGAARYARGRGLATG